MQSIFTKILRFFIQNDRCPMEKVKHVSSQMEAGKDWDKFPSIEREPRNIDSGFKKAGGSLKNIMFCHPWGLGEHGRAWGIKSYLKILSIFTKIL